MHWKLLLANLLPFVLVSVAFILFLARALEVREARPQLLRNGVSFFVPFLMAPMLYIFTLVLLPLFVLAMVGACLLQSPKAKGIVFWAGVGGSTGLAATMLYLFVLNTWL